MSADTSTRSSSRWIWLATASACLAAVGSILALTTPDDVYGRETAVLADAATAQDWVNLVVVAPLLVILGWRAQGDLRAHLVWFGCLAFTVYNYAIYAFSVHFGPLFLVWVAVLGLSLFALIGGLATVDADAIKSRFRAQAMRGPALLLMALAVMFALLWLSEIVPDLVTGSPSRSAAGWKVPTNPVHVLDLASFLPAVATSGFLLLRHHAWGYATVAGQLTWLALTGLPILATPIIAQARGHEAEWAVTGPIGLVVLVSLAALIWVIRQLGSTPETRPQTVSARHRR